MKTEEIKSAYDRSKETGEITTISAISYEEAESIIEELQQIAFDADLDYDLADNGNVIEFWSYADDEDDSIARVHVVVKS